MKSATAKCYLTSQAMTSVELGFCIGLLLAPTTGANMAHKHPICYFLPTTDFLSTLEMVAQTPLHTHRLECDVAVKCEEELSKSSSA